LRVAHANSLACILFISTFELGSTPFVLYINPYCTFCAFLVKYGDLLSLFFSSLAFGGFCFLFPFIVAQLHACVLCIALPAGLAVVPTQGFYFVFAIFFVIFRKQICFSSEGVAKDKLVFGMLKHGHVSFQILTWILL